VKQRKKSGRHCVGHRKALCACMAAGLGKSARELGLEFRPVEQTLADTVGWYRGQGWL
jgi:hypothetical protein